MADWNAVGYDRRSELQRTMASEVLALLHLEGAERILDVGCGNGKVTAQVAERVPQGSVVGTDASPAMIEFASSHYLPGSASNLSFQVADARSLPFHEEFDLVISFNALHWIPDQDKALRSIRASMKACAAAQLRLVPMGERKSIETVIEETRLSPRWRACYGDFHDPYLRLTPEGYRSLAAAEGFAVLHLETVSKAWDFETRQAFSSFCSVMLTEWTRRLPEPEQPVFVEDVLDRYREAACNRPGEENVFKFYQMDIGLKKVQ